MYSKESGIFAVPFVQAPSPLGLFYLIARQEQSCYLRLDEPLRLKAEPEAGPGDGLVIEPGDEGVPQR